MREITAQEKVFRSRVKFWFKHDGSYWRYSQWPVRPPPLRPPWEGHYMRRELTLHSPNFAHFHRVLAQFQILKNWVKD